MWSARRTWEREQCFAFGRRKAVRHNILQARVDQQIAHALFLFEVNVFALRRQFVIHPRDRNVFVAIQPRDFFDEIVRAVNVEAMIGDGDAQAWRVAGGAWRGFAFWLLLFNLKFQTLQ